MKLIRQEDRTAFSSIAKLTVPIALQNLLSAAVSSADVLMLNYVGQSNVSAVSLAAALAEGNFALPSTGALFTRTLTASPRSPSTPALDERGCALTFRTVPSSVSMK